jgi:rhomboid protease GluP
MLSPTAADVLAWIAADSPWFPARHAQSSGASRELYDAAIGDLMQAQLIEARDWVKDLGQAFALTDNGVRALRDPAVLARHLAGPSLEPAPVEPPHPTTYDRGERARQAYYSPGRPFVTQILLLLNIVVFFIGLIIAWKDGSGRMAYLNGHDATTLMKLGAVSGDALVRGEWWRLGAACFVHVGIVHLLMNLYSLGLLGALAESLWGRWRFLLIYFASGLAGSSLAMGHNPNSLMAGASGAIWGLMTSLAVWLFRYRQHFDADIVSEFGRRLAFAIILNVAVSFMPNVSWQGHFGGALGGVAMAVALDWIRPGYRRRTRAGIAAAVGIPIAIVAALFAVALRSEAWRPLLVREATRQQVRYLQGLQPELDANNLAAQTLFASTVRAGKNITRYPKLEAQARELLTQIASLRQRVKEQPRPPRLIADLPQKAEAYGEALNNFAQATIDYLVSEVKSPNALLEAKQALDERWADLFGNRWVK